MPKAYIVFQTDSEYTIIDEIEKRFHTVKKPLPQNREVVLEPIGEYAESMVFQVSEMIFTPHRLFTAVKDYEYNCLRKKEQYRRKIEKQQGNRVGEVENPFMIRT